MRQPRLGRELAVLRRDLFRQIDDDLRLFPRGVVLHLAVDHHGARAVRHGSQDLQCKGDFRRVGRIADVFRGTVPFFLTMLLMTVVLIHYQEIALWLPRLAFD